MDLDRRLALGRLPEELFLDPVVLDSDNDNDILGPDYGDDDEVNTADRTPKEQASRTSNTSEFPLPYLSSPLPSSELSKSNLS